MKKIALILVAVLFLSGGQRMVTVEAAPAPSEAQEIKVVQPKKTRKHKRIAPQRVQLIEEKRNEPEVEQEVVEAALPAIELTEEDHAEILALAQMANGEYNLIDTPEYKMYCAAVMWCAYWRSQEGPSKGFNSTIHGVCSQPYQFLGYNPYKAVSEDLMLFAEDVFTRCKQYEIIGNYEEVGCVLPKEYLWFRGTGYINIFRDAYQGGGEWDWSLPNPYEE